MFAPSFGNRPAYLVGRDALLERFVEGLSTEPGSRDRARFKKASLLSLN